MKKKIIWATIAAGLLLLSACESKNTVLPLITPDRTASPTPIVVPTCTPTVTPTPDPSKFPKASPTSTPTQAVEPTAEPTATPTLSPEPMATPSPEPTQAVEPTVTPTPSPKPTKTPTQAVEPTAKPTVTPTQAVEPTVTPTPTQAVEPTATPTPTQAVEPTVTPTPTQAVEPTATLTPSPTSTPTPSPTATLSPEPTATPTPSPSPTPTVNPEPLVTNGWQKTVSIDNKYSVVFPEVFNEASVSRTDKELVSGFSSAEYPEIEFQIIYTMQQTWEERTAEILALGGTITENRPEEKRSTCLWQQENKVYRAILLEAQYPQSLVGDTFGTEERVTGVMQVVFSYPVDSSMEYETEQYSYYVVEKGED